MAISDEQIIKAAEGLQKKGINPSMAKVREVLGSGSFTTISPVLRTWKESKEQRAVVAVDMPESAKQALDNAGLDLWKIITTIATERHLKIQAESEELIKSANIERDESLLEIERLELELTEKNTVLGEAEEKIESLARQYAEANNEVIVLDVKLAEKESVEQDNKALNEIHVQLVKEVSQVRNEKLELIEKNQSQEIRIVQTEGNLSNIKENLKETKTILKTKESELARLVKENNSLNLQVGKNQLALDQSAVKVSDLKSDVADFKKLVKSKDVMLLDVGKKNGILVGELKATKEIIKNANLKI